MSRGRHPRRIKLQPPDPISERRYLLRWSGRALHHQPDRFPPIDSAHLFGNRRPLRLEVGCGVADYLCDQAERRPDVNFIGVDLFMKGLYVAVDQAASLELENIRFIKADFKQLYRLLQPDSLETVYLHFPDPNIKARYRKRRMMDSEFLEQIHRALIPGGTLSVMTDEFSFFMDMLRMVEADPRFRKPHAARYMLGFEHPVKSRYQRIWEERGRTTRRFLVCKLPVEVSDLPQPAQAIPTPKPGADGSPALAGQSLERDKQF